jgi:DNA-binding protein HU-beta
MNKKQLAEEVAASTNLTKGQANGAVDAITEAIVDAVVSGDTVTLVGFGTFTIRERQARIGRNPRTGERLEIKAAAVPVFKPGKDFKEAVNK